MAKRVKLKSLKQLYHIIRTRVNFLYKQNWGKKQRLQPSKNIMRGSLKTSKIIADLNVFYKF